ncbi:hypothetical protein H6P81_004774 [Aristolochia fimbriata]|uniref:5-methyltetrahydropteroyltriglutamate--homocysteine S-methyltransferase n=1 Tax=Aristolochia fimbriata TaxID=158543 RepID=A0AAV7EUW7_ARIFI|nr:hypothetical protein H6P81_004774 [Aristolochia fimbriata]
MTHPATVTVTRPATPTVTVTHAAVSLVAPPTPSPTVRKLVVEVVEARDLLPKDGQGSSSPYVVADFDGQRRRTRTIVRDLNPVWNEALEFLVVDPNTMDAEELDVEVYNDKRTGTGSASRRNHFLGRVKLYGTQFAKRGEEGLIYFPLEKKSVFSWIRGVLGLRIYYYDEVFVQEEPKPEILPEKEPESAPPPPPPPQEPPESERFACPIPTEDALETNDPPEMGRVHVQVEDPLPPPPIVDPVEPPPPGPPPEELLHEHTPVVRKMQSGTTERVKGLRRPNGVDFAPRVIPTRFADSDRVIPSHHLVEPMQYLFVRIVKARGLLTASENTYVKIRAGSHFARSKPAINYLRAGEPCPEWHQVFALAQNSVGSTLEISVWDGPADAFLGGVCFDLSDVPVRDPPDSPLAPQWYRLEGADDRSHHLNGSHVSGDIMLSVWIGTQADDAFPESWNSESQYVAHTRSKVYQSPKLWYLRVSVIEAQDLGVPSSSPFDVRVKAQLGFQSARTRRSSSASHHNSSFTWQEDLIFVAGEPLEDQVILLVEDRTAKEASLLGHVIVPVNTIEQRLDERHVASKWFNLDGGADTYAGRIHLRLCLEGGYHVLDEAAHLCSDFRPTAKQLWKPAVGVLELGILGARALLPMKTKGGGGAKGSTDAYCVAKYGKKWIRTRTITDSFDPRWNEQYTWQVYDPCTVLTVGVFDNWRMFGEDKPDYRIGKVRRQEDGGDRARRPVRLPVPSARHVCHLRAAAAPADALPPSPGGGAAGGAAGRRHKDGRGLARPVRTPARVRGGPVHAGRGLPRVEHAEEQGELVSDPGRSGLGRRVGEVDGRHKTVAEPGHDGPGPRPLPGPGLVPGADRADGLPVRVPGGRVVLPVQAQDPGGDGHPAVAGRLGGPGRAGRGVRPGPDSQAAGDRPGSVRPPACPGGEDPDGIGELAGPQGYQNVHIRVPVRGPGAVRGTAEDGGGGPGVLLPPPPHVPGPDATGESELFPAAAESLGPADVVARKGNVWVVHPQTKKGMAEIAVRLKVKSSFPPPNINYANLHNRQKPFRANVEFKTLSPVRHTTPSFPLLPLNSSNDMQVHRLTAASVQLYFFVSDLFYIPMPWLPLLRFSWRAVSQRERSFISLGLARILVLVSRQKSGSSPKRAGLGWPLIAHIGAYLMYGLSSDKSVAVNKLSLACFLLSLRVLQFGHIRAMSSHVVGYPRIGPKRELKFALESFWDGRSTEDNLQNVAKDLRVSIWKQMAGAGTKFIPSNTFSLYDQVLDTTAMLGAVPPRYGWSGSDIGLELYFSMARGNSSLPAMELTKWFDTNYHYIVPELGPDIDFSYASRKAVTEYKEAKELGIETVPVLIGPVSYLLLSKRAKGVEKSFSLLSLVGNIIPIYKEVIADLRAAGATWVQFDEPTLVLDLDSDQLNAFSDAYAQLDEALLGLNAIIETYFADIPAEAYKTLIALKCVTAIGCDLIRGGRTIELIRKLGFPPDKYLFAGVVDGRNIWANDLASSLATLEEIESFVGKEKLVVSTSCSLLHTAVDLANETKLDNEIKSWLAFAAQKVSEVNVLAKALNGEKDEAYFSANAAAQASRKSSSSVNDEAVQTAVCALIGSDHRRATPASARLDTQQKKLNLPILPTTTIGSFPQTMDLRRIRREYKANKISEEAYVKSVKEEINKVVKIQEELDIDVLVHGEPERNDMVEYFGEQLKGFAFTVNGWVQSYGSRCVKPPIIYGDVSRPKPMTVFWSAAAQSMTNRPMKGMLTGPVTILNWSFVRNDQPRYETCYQIALAIKKEVEDLEAAGIQVIQIDEAALREGLPLRKSEQNFYLDWAVHSFRITNCGVKDSTQIHTHMCYSNFNDIIHSIIDMDADVITIENSRSDEKLLSVFREGAKYSAGIGPGVYDIHSPRIPSVEEIADRISKMLPVLERNVLWVNPDCGLKTRKYTEVQPALANMVAAAKLLRKELALAR